MAVIARESAGIRRELVRGGPNDSTSEFPPCRICSGLLRIRFDGVLLQCMNCGTSYGKAETYGVTTDGNKTR